MFVSVRYCSASFSITASGNVIIVALKAKVLTRSPFTVTPQKANAKSGSQWYVRHNAVATNRCDNAAVDFTVHHLTHSQASTDANRSSILQLSEYLKPAFLVHDPAVTDGGQQFS